MHIRRITVAMAALATAATALIGSPAQAATAYADQARALHLSAAEVTDLQRQADFYVAKMHGTRTGLNTVAFTGGNVVIALPSRVAVPADVPHCTYLHFCAYETDWTGSKIDMYACGNYPIPWKTNGHWYNDQSPGTTAIGHHVGGNFVEFYYAQTQGTTNWLPIQYVKNC